MTSLLSLAYLASAALVAAVIGNIPGIRRAAGGPAADCATATLLFFSALFAPFYVLGVYELATDRAVVTTANAAAILLPAAAIAVAARRKLGSQVDFSPASIWARASEIVRFFWKTPLAGLVAATFLLAAALLVCMFPRGFESSAYHLPVAVHIFQTHSLKVWDRVFVHTYAANASLYFGFLLSFLPERAVSAANLVLLPALGAAIYETSRSLGAAPRPAVLCALAVLSIPIVAFSAAEAEASTGALAFLAVALMYVSRPGPIQGWQAALAGLALGLSYGFKPVYLPAIGVVGLILAVRSLREAGPARALGLVVLCVTLTSLGAGHLLLRNQVQFANPFYPMQLPVVSKVMGWPKAPDINYARFPVQVTAWTRSRGEWGAYPWTESHLKGENYKHSSGFGPFLAVACVPAFVAVSLGVVSRRLPLFGTHGLFVFCAAAVFGVWWALVSDAPAYAIGGIVFLAPLAAWCASQMGLVQQRIYTFALSLSVVAMLFVFASKLLIEFGDKIVLSRQWTRHDDYLYPAAVDDLPPGSCVMNLGRRPWNYSAFGARLANRIVCFELAVQGPQDAMEFDQGPELTAITLNAGLIREAGVTHILTSADRPIEVPASLQLQEIARLDRNPHDGTAYPHAPVLYKVIVREAPEDNSAQ
jgi:hypothetical protein